MTRIIAGIWRGHPLPKLTQGSVRPTTDRARTVLFDTLRDVSAARVLDLYSGTGALGFEALSRGASSLTSIDHDRNYIELQKEWIKQHDKAFKAYVGDVLKMISRLNESYDLVFADPPYAEGLAKGVLEQIESKIARGGRFIYERGRRDEKLLNSEILTLQKEKIVAETKLQIYKAY